MSSSRSLGLALLALVVMPFASAATDTFATHLYVSPSGNDQSNGKTPAGAFATLGRARDEIRHLKASGPLPSGGVAVEIAGGTYSLTESFALTEADSGTAEAPVVYRALENQKVQLLGGRILPLSAFKPVTDDAMLARLDPAARGHVVSACIATLGLTHAGPFPPIFSDSGGIFELFWDGRRQPLSRWPNEGWTTMKHVLVNGDKSNPGVFEYRDDRPSRWLQNPELWLKGQWRVGWEDPAIRVAKIDAAAGTITFAAILGGGIGNKYTRDKKTGVGPGNGKEPWCALNLPEEIDIPGEWAIDFTNQTLFFWPPAAKGELMVSQLDQPMISVTNTAHVRFVGLTLEASLGDGIVLQNADSVLIAGCTIRNLSRNAVILNGRRSGVQSCELSLLGEGGVMVSGGDKKSLTPSENFIINNHIHDYGVLKAMYSAAVNVGFGGINAVGKRDAVGIRVAHNLIHDAPRDAVLVSGQDNVFEFNEIYNCGFASADVGAFYSWLDWTIRATIRYNYIHDTVGGVNPDDGASGMTVYGNVFVGPRTGVWIASGPDQNIENNIFVKDEGPVFGMDDRGNGRGYATNPKLIKGVEAIEPTKAPWAKRFPEMVTLLADHPELPLRTRFVRNLIVIPKGEPIALKMSKANQANPKLFFQADNFVTAEDPGFVNAAKGDYALKSGSVVFKKIPGFKAIPFDQIGLKLDAYRRTLPQTVSGELAPGETAPPQPDQIKNFGT
jgi:hypothetical protein